VAVVAPALGEELLFRAALLPAPGVRAPAWRSAVPVLLFVLWHPPQALLFGPHWEAVVLDPWFLAAVAVLGTALTRLYLATGSIWPPVLLHWATIVGWKAWFGAPSPWLSR
jgi:predicted Abi (CAAX) family protease